MTATLKLTKIGNSVGVILPKEVLARLKVAQGDSLFLVEVDEGYNLTPYDARFASQVEAGEAFATKYRDVLRKLAK
jgi:putative addiction module antidote